MRILRQGAAAALVTAKMVNWAASVNGKSAAEVADWLSQLPNELQQQLEQHRASLVDPALPPIWKLVLLNNKDRQPWGKNWPHELAWQRNPIQNRGNNTLVLAKTKATFLRIGLLPLANQGPSQHGAQPATESVSITLHHFVGDAPITATQLGRSLFVATSPSTNPNTLEVPTTQFPRADGASPWGSQTGNEEALAGLVQRVQNLHSHPDILEPQRLPNRIAAVTQASADLQGADLTETTFRFFFNMPNRGEVTFTPTTLLYLCITLDNDPRVTVRTEPFRLLAREHKEKVTGNKRSTLSSTGSAKRRKGAGTSAGAGPSSLGAAAPSGGGPGDGGVDDVGGDGGGDGGDDGPGDALPSSPEAAAFMHALLQLGEFLPPGVFMQEGPLQLPPPAVQAPGDQGGEAVALLQENPALNLQIGGAMTDGPQPPLPDLVLGLVPLLMIDDDDDLGELGGFDQEPHLEGSFPQGQPPSPPDDGDGGGAGYTDLGAGGDDSAPKFTSCSAPEGTGGAYRSLGATSGDDAGGEAGLLSAMRRVGRAKRDTARALLLAIVRAAGAQQQQQPGATPLAQLREELEDLKAWLGL